MRICLIASARHPIAEPFAGGLESITHVLATELTRRGHDVTLFAAPGSDTALSVRELAVSTFTPSEVALGDTRAPSREWLADHHAYLGLMMELARDGAERYDVVHNNSLHHLPVAMAPGLTVPVVTTLHTPPLPWIESAVALAGVVPTARRSSFVAVSHDTARAWSHVVDAAVVHNGVDVDRFVPGPGGGPAVWSGRLVPEKAPHEAIAACRRAGVDLLLAGPVSHTAYFEEQVLPALGDGIAYVGHLAHRELVSLLGRASVAITTPAWDEPYGLVAAEALACGTPVAAYARGALPEILTAGTGALARPGDVDDLARAILAGRGLSRTAARARAVDACSLATMVDAYEDVYDELAAAELAA